MLKIFEIKNTINDTNIVDNMYEIQKLIRNMILQTEFILDINKDDYNYINIVLEKTKINLDKIYKIMKT